MLWYYSYQGRLFLAESKLVEAKACFAQCAEDIECQVHHIFVLISQDRYEEAADAIRRISGRSGRATNSDVTHAKALVLIKLGDVQGAISAIGQLSISASTPVACTAGAVYWMDGDMSAAETALHACASFSRGLTQLLSSAESLVSDHSPHESILHMSTIYIRATS